MHKRGFTLSCAIIEAIKLLNLLRYLEPQMTMNGVY